LGWTLSRTQNAEDKAGHAKAKPIRHKTHGSLGTLVLKWNKECTHTSDVGRLSQLSFLMLLMRTGLRLLAPVIKEMKPALKTLVYL
jgi:hypothetical protein